jgi:hypothetical protein
MDDVEQESTTDALVSELMPEGLDWERLVQTYPLPALALAALGGFYLGFRHGPEILTAVSGYAAAELSRNVGEILGQELG